MSDIAIDASLVGTPPHVNREARARVADACGGPMVPDWCLTSIRHRLQAH